MKFGIENLSVLGHHGEFTTPIQACATMAVPTEHEACEKGCNDKELVNNGKCALHALYCLSLRHGVHHGACWLHISRVVSLCNPVLGEALWSLVATLHCHLGHCLSTGICTEPCLFSNCEDSPVLGCSCL